MGTEVFGSALSFECMERRPIYSFQTIIEHRLYARQCYTLGTLWGTMPDKVPVFMELRDMKQEIIDVIRCEGRDRGIWAAIDLWLFLEIHWSEKDLAYDWEMMCQRKSLKMCLHRPAMGQHPWNKHVASQSDHFEGEIPFGWLSHPQNSGLVESPSLVFRGNPEACGEGGKGPISSHQPPSLSSQATAVSPVTDDESWQGADLDKTRPGDPSALARETPH